MAAYSSSQFTRAYPMALSRRQIGQTAGREHFALTVRFRNKRKWQGNLPVNRNVPNWNEAQNKPCGASIRFRSWQESMLRLLRGRMRAELRCVGSPRAIFRTLRAGHGRTMNIRQVRGAPAHNSSELDTRPR